MINNFKKAVFSLSILSATGITALSIAPSALAITFYTDKSVELSSSDKDQYFKVSFDGNVEGKDVNGLSSEAVFQFLGFTQSTTTKTITQGNKTTTTNVDTILAKFNIFLTNTTNPQITSRVSALGFDTNKVELGGSTSPVKTGYSTLFSNAIIGGSFPNKFGDVDICFTNGNTCEGGKNGGVSNSQSIPGIYKEGSFQATIALERAATEDPNNYQLRLGDFGVRYQSIDGEIDAQSFNGASGTGRGVSVVSYTPPKRKIPESSTLSVVLLAGVMLTCSQKRKLVKAVI